MERIELIKKIFEEFEKNNVRYCILRNYEFLLGGPLEIEGNLCIDEKDLTVAEDILNRNGFVKRDQQFSLKHKSYLKLINLKKVSFDVQVGGVYWNDVKYLDVLNNRIKKNFFYTPSDNDTFVMLIAHSILGKRYFKPEYQRIIQQLNVNESYVKEKLVSIFGSNAANRLYNKVRSGNFAINPWPYVIKFILKPKHLALFIPLSLRWIGWKKPFQLGPLISVLGPDGAGKSSLVENLKSYLVQNDRKVSVIYTGRGRNHILPITVIGRIYRSKEKKKDNLQPNKEIKAKPSYKRKILYTLMAPIYSFDLLLRYIFKIFPERLTKKIVITDRYCSDILLMKHVPFLIKKALYLIFPKPTLTVFLYNDPETLVQRRPEETLEELTRQMEIFNKFEYSIKVKTDNQEEDTNKILTETFTKLLQRWN